MKRIGIFGGAFDPPHMGHVFAVTYALAVGGFDQVWIIPCWEHAFGKKMAPFEDRIQMCVRAFDPTNYSKVKVMSVEGVIQSKYTVDLLKHLKEKYPDHIFNLIVGQDEWADFDNWHKARGILSMVPVWVIGRDGVPSSHLIKIPDISSTNIRNELQWTGNSESCKGLVPAAVLEYIGEKTLYLQKAGIPCPSL